MAELGFEPPSAACLEGLVPDAGKAGWTSPAGTNRGPLIVCLHSSWELQLGWVCVHPGAAGMWEEPAAGPIWWLRPPASPAATATGPPCIDEAQRGTVSHPSQGSQLARGRGGVSSGLRCPGLCPRPLGSDAQPSGSWAGAPGRRVTSPSHAASLGLRPQVQRLHQGLPQRAAGRRWLPEDLQAILPVWGPHQVRHICF